MNTPKLHNIHKTKKSLVYKTFVRFGKLGLVKQEAYGNDTFHSPPAHRGFYAMPIRFQEYFLIGTIEVTQPDQFNMPKSNEIDYELYNKKRKERMSAIRHEFTIDVDDEFWHHLNVPNNEVINRHNSWIKTTYKTWEKAVKKESLRLRSETGGSFGINSGVKRTGLFSKDHFEVFFLIVKYFNIIIKIKNMTIVEKIEKLKDNNLSEWLKTRQSMLNEMSNKQPIFCTCGKLATGLHESTCRKFNKEVDNQTLKKLSKLK